MDLSPEQAEALNGIARNIFALAKKLPPNFNNPWRQCEYIVPARAWEPAHQCRFTTIHQIEGRYYCGTHSQKVVRLVVSVRPSRDLLAEKFVVGLERQPAAVTA